jgi:hypothetical protein
MHPMCTKKLRVVVSTMALFLYSDSIQVCWFP